MRWRNVAILGTALCTVACSGDADRTIVGEQRPELAAEPQVPLRIVVIGGTAGIGLETVRLALDRGHSVTAMARRPEQMTLSHERLTIVGGDILDSSAVEAAVAGNDAVVTTIGVGPTRKPVSVFSEGARNVLSAMDKAGVRRLIAVTGIGAGDSAGHGGFFYDRIFRPLFLKTVYEDKDREEDLIRASGVDWTIVRPGFLNDDAAERRYRVFSDLAGISAGDISRADVAHFIIATLESPHFVMETVLLTN